MKNKTSNAICYLILILLIFLIIASVYGIYEDNRQLDIQQNEEDNILHENDNLKMECIVIIRRNIFLKHCENKEVLCYITYKGIDCFKK